MVIPKHERFKCKVSTASISGLIETLELEIEIFIEANTSLDDGPDLIASRQVARIKGYRLLQLFVRGASVKCLAVKDCCT